MNRTMDEVLRALARRRSVGLARQSPSTSLQRMVLIAMAIVKRTRRIPLSWKLGLLPAEGA
jgi:hypothetical protein